MPTRINIRCTGSYMHLFEPKAIAQGQDPKYSVQLVLPVGHDYGEINAAVNEAIFAKWGQNPPPGLKMPVIDPQTKPKLAANPFYAGRFYVSANSKERPKVLYHNGSDMLVAGDIYSGCEIVANVNFYAFDTAGNQGVACGLNMVIKLADGERLDNRPSAEEAFGAYIDPNATQGVQAQPAAPGGYAPQQGAPAQQYAPAQQAAPAQAAPAQAAPAQAAPPGGYPQQGAPAQAAPQGGYQQPGQPAPQAAPPGGYPQQGGQVAPGASPAIDPATGQPYTY